MFQLCPWCMRTGIQVCFLEGWKCGVCNGEQIIHSESGLPKSEHVKLYKDKLNNISNLLTANIAYVQELREKNK